MSGRDYRVVPAELTVRATESDTVQFRLYQGTAGFDLTGVGTTELHLRNNAGATVTFTTAGASPKLSVNGTAGGSVAFTPGTADLVAGSAPYHGYFKLNEGGSISFIPEAWELTIHVRKTL